MGETPENRLATSLKRCGDMCEEVRDAYGQLYAAEWALDEKQAKARAMQILAQKHVQQLTKIKSLVPVQEIFDFQYHNTIASVNGLRLTKRHEVGWNEVNAALGYLCQALVHLARRLSHTFVRIIPVCKGPASYFINTGKQEEIKLYCSVSFPAFSKNNRLNIGLKCLLLCCKELLDRFHNPSPPFDVCSDRIAGLSVMRPPENTEKEWENAMHQICRLIEWMLVRSDAPNTRNNNMITI